MTSPEEIYKKAAARYKDFLIYKASLLCDSDFEQDTDKTEFFPLEIKANKGKAGDDLHKRKAELEALFSKSKNKTGRGYTLILDEVNTRGNGTQGIIRSIIFENEDDYLSFIAKKSEAQTFCAALNLLLTDIHSDNSDATMFNLQNWTSSHLNVLCQKHEKDFWENILLCVHYFREHTECNLYIREIPLKVHTKFIEENKALILSLIPNELPASQFEKALGLKTKPGMIRFRPLDKNMPLTVAGSVVQEMTLSADDFSSFGSNEFCRKIKRIFIVENEMIFLTFPCIKSSLCIWGHGYTVSLLSECKWLSEKDLFYFGDIDEHGFDILSTFRKSFPGAKSFCMDKKTLDRFEDFRVKGEALKADAVPQNLTEKEKSVFNILHMQKEKGRLEQERINQDYILSELKTIFGAEEL